MSAIAIRPVEVEDAEAMQRLFNAPGVRWGTLQSGITSVAEWRKRLGDQIGDRDAISLVATVDGQIVGEVSLHRGVNPRHSHVADLGICVRDDYTGRGIGTALMAAILDLSDNWLNVHRVELNVYTDNAAAIHLYEKFGFAREGVRRDVAFRAGRYVDCYHMGRLRPLPDAKKEA